MDLASERKAAYEAVFATGLTPLMFETEPELVKADRDRINSLVDHSDLFLGIYDREMGPKNVNYHDMAPIAYELYRFVIAQDLRQAGPSMDLNEEIANQIGDERVIREIRRSARRGGQYSRILAERVRLFVRADGYLNKELAEFLQPFYLHRFESSEISYEAGLPQFRSPVIDLQHKIMSQVERAIASRRFQLADPLGWGIEVVTDLHNRPGALFHILTLLFSNRLNILDVFQENTKDKRYRLSFLCRSHDIAGTKPKRVATAAEKNLRRGLPQSPCKVSIIENIEDSLQKRISARSGDDHRENSRYVLDLRTLRAPGILASIAKRVYSYDINVDYIQHEEDKRLSIIPCQGFRLLFDLPQKDSMLLRKLACELPAIAGVLEARIYEQVLPRKSKRHALRKRTIIPVPRKPALQRRGAKRSRASHS